MSQAVSKQKQGYYDRLSSCDSGTPLARDGKPSKGHYWTSVLKKWQESGMSKAAFCRKEGLRLSTFNIWCTALCGREAERQRRDPALAESLAKELCPKVVAELEDENGAYRVSIFEGASPALVNLIIEKMSSISI